jgi:hypothetical protein
LTFAPPGRGAADVEEGVTLAALDELLAAELVRPTGRPRRFRFRHPLLRRAVQQRGRSRSGAAGRLILVPCAQPQQRRWKSRRLLGMTGT